MKSISYQNPHDNASNHRNDDSNKDHELLTVDSIALGILSGGSSTMKKATPGLATV